MKKDQENYIEKLNSAQTLKQLGPEPDDFELWCLWKHNEIRIKTKTTNQNDLDVHEVSSRVSTYAADLSWAISEYLLISRRLKKEKEDRQHWYNEKHIEAVGVLKQRGNSSPAVKTIEAYIEQTYYTEYVQWQDKLNDLEFKQLSLEKHLTLWMKLDKVYSNLLYELNSEFYRTYKQHRNEEDPDELVREVIRKGLPDYE